MQVTSLAELKKHTRKAGVKVFASVPLTNDDSILVEVKKSSFLDQINEWSDEYFGEKNSRVDIVDDGDILLG